MIPVCPRPLLAILCLACCLPPALADGPLAREGAALVPKKYRTRVLAKLETAREAGKAWVEVLKEENAEGRAWIGFLLAYAPRSDLACMTPDLLRDILKGVREARRNFPWARKVPDEILLHYVLPPRSAQEPLEKWRTAFFESLAPRLKGVDSASRAAILVNEWCHEHATFKSTNRRDQGPLTTIRRGIGRCEEEMILTIDALRAVGLPARPCFTPYWAHTDNNHAWVEVYAGGRWWYMGGCEPAPRLSDAWFTQAARRAAMVFNITYGIPENKDHLYRADHDSAILNSIGVYSKTCRVQARLLDPQGKPVKGVSVWFNVFNFGSLRAIGRATTGAQGRATLELGIGDFIVTAAHDGARAHKKITTRPDGEETITLRLSPLDRVAGRFELHYPLPPAPKEQAASGARKASEAVARLRRTQAALRNRIRKTALLEGRAASPELMKLLRKSDPGLAPLVEAADDAERNGSAILKAYLEAPEEERAALIELVADLGKKDRVEISRQTLLEHVHCAIEARKRFRRKVEEGIWRKYVLSPRIALEPMHAWRAALLEAFGKDATPDVAATALAINRRLKAECTIVPPSRLGNTPTPRDTWVLRAGTQADLANLAVGALRAVGVPARVKRTWAEYHQGGTWHPLYPLDPGRIGDLERKGGAASTYAEPGHLVIKITRRGRPYPQARFYRQWCITRFLDEGTWTDLDRSLLEKIDRKGEVFTAQLPPGRYTLFAGDRNRNGDAFFTAVPLEVESGKTLEATVAIDVPLRGLTPGERLARKLDPLPDFRLPAASANKPEFDLDKALKKGPVLLVIFDPSEEPSQRMLPKIAAVAGQAASAHVRIVGVTLGGAKGVPEAIPVHGGGKILIPIFKLPLDPGTGKPKTLPAVILIAPGRKVFFSREGYDLSIDSTLGEVFLLYAKGAAGG